MRFRFNLRTLLFATVVCSFVFGYYGFATTKRQADHKTEQKALNTLRTNGWRIHVINTASTNSGIGGRVADCLNWPIDVLTGGDSSTRCETLWVHHVPEIPRGDNDPIDALLRLKQLKQVRFRGSNMIDLEDYQRLVAGGIEVSHRGIGGVVLDENYILCPYVPFDHQPTEPAERAYLAVNQTDSSLSVQLVEGEKGLRFSADLKTHDLQSSGGVGPNINLKEMLTEGRFKDLIGRDRVFESEATEQFTYIKTHRKSLELISLKGNSLHLKWTLKPKKGLDGVADFSLPIKQVTVCLQERLKKEAAMAKGKSLLSEHFDLDDFFEPSVDLYSNEVFFDMK